MTYKFFQKNNYEDFSSGRVIFHKPKNPDFPVRLAGEIFSRCLEHTHKTKNIHLHDPCCGSAYLLTVLGFLFNEKIEAIYGSDIKKESVDFAQNNLSLLSTSGIGKRKRDLTDLIKKYKKQSHVDAVNSLNNISKYIKHEITINTFVADILEQDSLRNKNFCADVVISDIPYGGLAAWSKEAKDPINTLLNSLAPIINNDTIIAIIYNKHQRLNNHQYNRIEKFKTGHRIIEIMKLK
jgi:tRNA G10  N-methylase Trm11